MTLFDEDPVARRFIKRWNFRPMWYRPKSGLIDLFQIFATPFLTLQLHYVRKPDPSTLYHDHPWKFLSFMLKGSYTEKILKDPYDMSTLVVKKRRRFSLHYINDTIAHNITECSDHTVTLFLAGPWTRDGFRFYKDGQEFDVSRFSLVPAEQSNMMRLR